MNQLRDRLKSSFIFPQRLADESQTCLPVGRVSQKIYNMNFNSAKLSVKLSETLRDILFLNFYVNPI